MLYLFCLPCSDGKECNIIAEVKISLSGNEQHHNHEDEACSPFCICTCCASLAVYQQLAKVLPAKLFIPTQKHFIANDLFLYQEFSSIWQPPKIA